ncbi:MAG: hypothetical protein RR923_05670 [Bacilli bacterium]
MKHEVNTNILKEAGVPHSVSCAEKCIGYIDLENDIHGYVKFYNEQRLQKNY